MYTRCRALVLHWLKVPPEPHPPAGDPASLRVFRAGKNYLNLRLVTWAIPQLFALAGIIFWTVVLIDVETAVRSRRSAPTTAVASASTITEPAPTRPPALTSPAGKSVRKRARINDWAEFKQMLVAVAARLPWWSFPLLWLFKVGGIALYLAQIPLTFALRRLDFELRWYVVTDRSLRIRTGVWNVQELTMSFANLQQVEVSQGPLQGFLGLADVRVQSAGGGSGEGHAHGQRDSLHTAMFHSVENATEIRDLILERLRLFRATGLGDPDEQHAAVSVPLAPAASATTTPDTLTAAHELLAEARELRRTLAS
jgi:membrane protein YdbS with pleckstrin-like domain